jgi:altronate hydrolase
MICQNVEDEFAEGERLLSELCDYAAQFERTEVPTSELVIGLKCGGSDGFSGITANPLVGSLADRLVAEGGSAMLTEVPEMFGAETLLMARCKDRAVFDKTVHLINDFKQYYIDNHQVVYENPSPGNKKGGITTLEDKSLGCTQKGGTAPEVDVLAYGEPIREKGLNLVCGPGNDLVAATTVAAAGAHVVLFTTGRGTPFGCPVPTVKISSNTDLFHRKRGWIDFNAGQLVEGKTMPQLTEELLCLSARAGQWRNPDPDRKNRASARSPSSNAGVIL